MTNFDEFMAEVLQDMEEKAKQEEQFYKELALDADVDLMVQQWKEDEYADCYLPY